MVIKEKEIVSDFQGGSDQSKGQDKLQKYKSLADSLKSQDAKANPNNEEEKKEEQKQAAGDQAEIQRIDLVAKANQLVAAKPWIDQLKQADSKCRKLVDNSVSHFNKKSRDLLLVAQLLGYSPDK